MSTLLKPYPDAELVLLDLIDPHTPGPVVTATPTTLTAPLTLVERIGGPDDGVTDRPRMKVTCFGATRQEAWVMTRGIQAVILAAGGTMVTGQYTVGEYPGGVLIDKAVTGTPPKQMAESGRNARQIETVFEIHLRRPWW